MWVLSSRTARNWKMDTLQISREYITMRESGLMSTVRLSPLFWATLEKHGVLRIHEKNDIQKNGTVSPDRQISKLMYHIKQKPETRYNGLLRALVDTGQGHVVNAVLQHKVPHSLRCQILLDKLPELREEVKIVEELWEVLMRNHVLSHYEVEDFRDHNTNAQQVEKLIRYIIRGDKKIYRGFLYALSETGQRHVVTDVLKDDVPNLMPIAHEEQVSESSVLLTEGKKKLLIEKAPDLIQKIELTTALWTQIVKCGVIPEAEINDIKTGLGPDAAKMAKVLEILRKGTMRHYNGFVRALTESYQTGVVTDILGEDITNYKLKEIGPMIAIPKLNEAVTNLRREYCCKLSQLNLHEGSDFEKVYTPLNLIEIVNGKKTKMTENQILQGPNDGPISTLCVGEAGTGKSTQAHRLAYHWAKGKDVFHPFWSKLKAVLLVQPTDEADTLHQTLMNAIPGKQVYKDLIWDLYQDEPEAVLVIVEALDQFKKAGVIKDIQQMVQDGETNILLTIRKNHPNMTFQNLFTQHIEVNGFTQRDSVQFVKKFLGKTKSPEMIEAFLTSIKGNSVFELNPLNLTLACLYYSSGELKHSRIKTLTEVELYAMRERRLVERELENRPVKCDPREIPDMKARELYKIHTLAADMIVARKTKCRKSDLDNLGIDLKSPVMVLLQEHQTFSFKDGKDYFWVWRHIRLQEFAAAMAVVELEGFRDSLWPLWVASRPDLNSMSLLIAAQLGIAGRYDDVITLTNATMALQCKTECDAVQDMLDDPSHACSWKTEVMKNISKIVSNKTAFHGPLFKLMLRVQKRPQMEAIFKCTGSPFRDNINLFEHVQMCWKLGSIHVARTNFISMTESLLLPASHRSESETLHLMVSEPSQWMDTWKASGAVKSTVVEIHLGLSSTDMKEENALLEEWTECVKGVLKNVQPQVVHLHHAHNLSGRPTEELVSFVNKNQHLMDVKGSTWSTWHSGDDVKHTQEYIPNTDRFVYISRTRDDEITFNVECLKDTLLLTPKDDYLERPEVVFNIGFPTAHSDSQIQSEETVDEWQLAINNLLDLWHPKSSMLIRSFNHDHFGNIIVDKFKQVLRKEKEGMRQGYDTIHEYEDGISFHHMAETHEGGIHKEMHIYNSMTKGTTVRVQKLADILGIKAEDISMDIRDTVTLCLSDGGDFSSTSDLAAELGISIRHLLDELKVQRVVVREDTFKSVGPQILIMIHDLCESWSDVDDFSLFIRGRQLHISRKQRVQVPDTPRSVTIYEDEEDMNIVVERLFDCFVLDREHITLSKGNRLFVNFATSNTHSPCDGWYQIFTYLLETFQPPAIGVNVIRAECEIQDKEFPILLGDGSVYQCGWNTTETRLLLIRIENVQRMEVPDTSRCVTLYQHGDTMKVLTDCLSDCLVLRSEHVKLLRGEHVELPTEHDLYVRLLTGDASSLIVSPPKEGCIKVFTHLLEAFHPPLVDFNIVKTKCDIQDREFHILLDDGALYLAGWNSTGTRILMRMDDLEKVEEPHMRGCVRLYRYPAKYMNIVVEHLSDCLMLQKEHITLSPTDKLFVHIHTQDATISAASSPIDRWQQVFIHLLDTFRPPAIGVNIVMTECGIPDSAFHTLLDDGTVYRCEWSDTGTPFLLTRIDTIWRVPVPDTANCVMVYERNEYTYIVVDCLTDSLVLQKKYIKSHKEHEMYMQLLTQDFAPGIAPNPTEGWQKAFTHMLETFHPPLIGVDIIMTKCGIQGRPFLIILEDGAVYQCYWNKTGTRFVLERKESCQVLTVLGTSRYVGIMPGYQGIQSVVARHLSDCLVLRSEHIQRTDGFTLGLDLSQILSHPAAAKPDTATQWQDTIQHLLETFYPGYLVIVMPEDEPQPLKTFCREINDGSVCVSQWEQNNSMFIVTRNVNVHKVEDLETSRCVQLYQNDEDVMNIVVDSLSDCLVLRREHIKLSGEYELHVHLLNRDTAKSARSSATEGWQHASTHLLETFHPAAVAVNVFRDECDVHDTAFYMMLDDGALYHCDWDDTGTPFIMKKKRTSHMLEVPSTSRCVAIIQEDHQTLSLVAHHLSDCLTINPDHIKTTGILIVRVDLRLILSDQDAAKPDTATEWQQTIHHLLETFHPIYLVIIVPGDVPELMRTFCRKIKDGSAYVSQWVDNNTALLIQRQDGLSVVELLPMFDIKFRVN